MVILAEQDEKDLSPSPASKTSRAPATTLSWSFGEDPLLSKKAPTSPPQRIRLPRPAALSPQSLPVGTPAPATALPGATSQSALASPPKPAILLTQSKLSVHSAPFVPLPQPTFTIAPPVLVPSASGSSNSGTSTGTKLSRTSRRKAREAAKEADAEQEARIREDARDRNKDFNYYDPSAAQARQGPPSATRKVKASTSQSADKPGPAQTTNFADRVVAAQRKQSKSKQTSHNKRDRQKSVRANDAELSKPLRALHIGGQSRAIDPEFSRSLVTQDQPTLFDPETAGTSARASTQDHESRQGTSPRPASRGTAIKRDDSASRTSSHDTPRRVQDARSNERKPGQTNPSQRQSLFDPRRDDPVRFAAVSRLDERSPLPARTNDSGKSGNSNGNALDSLKKAYRVVVDLEKKCQAENVDPNADQQNGRHPKKRLMRVETDDAYWIRLTMPHRELAEAHLNFLQMALDPRMPASLQSLPQKYNIATRLWQTAFHALLERMRSALPHSKNDDSNVLEHLTEFIYFAYTFYTNLLEEQALAVFRSSWLEQLGDLARYRMAIAGLGASEATSELPARESSPEDESSTEEHKSPAAASIGDAALGDWEVEEQGTWRDVARDWYARGVAETPNRGRLHHHLALLSKDDSMRALYHYCRSLTASEPFWPARESMLTLFSSEAQKQRAQAGATAGELFVHLQGMLFTKVDLDDYDDVLARFREALRVTFITIKAGQRIRKKATLADARWSMMGIITVTALLQFGADESALKAAMGKEAQAVTNDNKPSAIMIKSSKAAEDSSVEHRTVGNQSADEYSSPVVFTLAAQLAYELLEHVITHLYRPDNSHPAVCPYITIHLAFLHHISSKAGALRLLERYVPWKSLVNLFCQIPSQIAVRADPPHRISGTANDEDWCLRGTDWIGRERFARGFWRTRSAHTNGEDAEASHPAQAKGPESEIDYLASDPFAPTSELILPSGQVESEQLTHSQDLARGRWQRIALMAVWLAKTVPGLSFNAALDHQHKFSLQTILADRASTWAQARQRAAYDKRSASLEREQAGHTNGKAPRKAGSTAILANQTIFVFDTNILMTDLQLLDRLLPSGKWIVIIPLMVVTELDGLAKETSEAGASANKALDALRAALSDHPDCIKLQTSRGNYLNDLNIRWEAIDFSSDAQGEQIRSIDDVILQAAIWQSKHGIGLASASPTDPVVVALVTADRNLRLKATVRSLLAGSSQQILQWLEAAEASNG
ncbi:uncharacterized protein L969DRAFT_74677 [Mixia osmundae IAM 14324]|uniref:PIN domain-containing protein n=1 Tax=Mixia osmundae (strain CBS 9802 / IAM 14324 / JCM 22182 / KY 12970) TaxID=764103 RepID=G7E0U4_MIXOS|nr:uncharacterized protein L969DRAFT_74677 [Mixia osmundae IAM 14324]KEI39483.1 hypothetical protein L969DRAFT_74677 [Mixia osmundae IAM 14324]GAA96454.1 hypothetical protein E5Q_03121 [Mixia osmundae IAM 14324]